MQKVIIHSPGMISVDASEITPDRSTLDFLKNSNLYHALIEKFGSEQAVRIIESNAPDHRSQAEPPSRTK